MHASEPQRMATLRRRKSSSESLRPSVEFVRSVSRRHGRASRKMYPRQIWRYRELRKIKLRLADRSRTEGRAEDEEAVSVFGGVKLKNTLSAFDLKFLRSVGISAEPAHEDTRLLPYPSETNNSFV